MPLLHLLLLAHLPLLPLLLVSEQQPLLLPLPDSAGPLELRRLSGQLLRQLSQVLVSEEPPLHFLQGKTFNQINVKASHFSGDLYTLGSE